MSDSITIRKQTVDGAGETKTYKRFAAAQAYAQKWVGEHPDLGDGYAVSADGIVTISVTGCPLADLFPSHAINEEREMGQEPADAGEAATDAHEAAVEEALPADDQEQAPASTDDGVSPTEAESAEGQEQTAAPEGDGVSEGTEAGTDEEPAAEEPSPAPKARRTYPQGGDVLRMVQDEPRKGLGSDQRVRWNYVAKAIRENGVDGSITAEKLAELVPEGRRTLRRAARAGAFSGWFQPEAPAVTTDKASEA